MENKKTSKTSLEKVKSKKVAKKDERPRLPIPRTGYYTTLNEEVTEEICNHLSLGAPYRAAYEAAGVKKDTFYSWLRKAESDHFDEVPYEESPYMIFADRVKTAYAQGEMRLIREINEGDRNWQAKAWLLERTRFAEYGLKQNPEIVVNMPGPNAPPDPPKTQEEWVKNVLKRQQAIKDMQENATDAEFTDKE